MPSATALDGHNWMFPVVFGFYFYSETIDNFDMVAKEIGNPPYLALSSDAYEGLENATKTLYPWAKHRFFFALDEELCQDVSRDSLCLHVSCS